MPTLALARIESFLFSNRLIPNNIDGDGDIFSVDPTNPQGLLNISGSGLSGDDEDYACASDFGTGRNRLFFVSERTDIGNDAGDVDIFVVSMFGGVIANVTDSEDTGDRDDSCLGLVASSGAVVFESARTDIDNDEGDLDIFVATLDTDPLSGQVFGATISNRTAEKAGASTPEDRLVYIGPSFLYFESTRDEADDSADAFANPNQDQHIFRVRSSGSSDIDNLTHDF